MIPKSQNKINNPILGSISPNRYENIFNVYEAETNGKVFPYYNITNKILLPDDIDGTLLSTVTFNIKTPWTLAAFALYGSMYYWYLLFVLNKNLTSKFYISPGETITYIKPEYLGTIVTKINE